MWISRFILFLGPALLYARLYWGIDFTDESYMVLNSIGPLLGARPFIDEMMISQSASLLMTPFAFLFHLAVPSHTGVVLFFRHLYFALAVGAMVVVYRALSGKLSDTDRALCAVLPLTFIPCLAPVPSYNSMVYFFALAGQMLFLNSRSLNAGALHSLAAFAHPSYLSGAGANVIVSLWSRRPHDFRHYITGSLVFVALVLLFMLIFGFENIKNSYHFSTQAQTFGGSSKLAMIWGEFLGYWRRPLLVALWAGACLVTGLAGRLNWAVAMGGFAVTQDFIIPEEVAYGLHQRFVCYGLFSAFLIAVDRKGWRDQENRTWICRLWIPSFVAGCALSFVSSNGLLMAPLGWIGCLIYTFWRMMRHGRPKTLALKEWRWAVQTAAALFILVQAQVFTLTHFYRDDSLLRLDTRIEDGPFAGIYTTHQRRNFINGFRESMAQLGAKPGESVFIYDMFAAGYLLTSLKPNGPAYMSILPQWMPQMRPSQVQYFREPANWPTYAVEFFYFPFGANNLAHVNPRGQDPIGDPFKEFFARTGKFETVFDSQIYRILKKREE